MISPNSFSIALGCLDFVEFDSVPTDALEIHGSEKFLTFRGINQRDEPNFKGWTSIRQILDSCNGNLKDASTLLMSDANIDGIVKKYYENSFVTLNLTAVIEQSKINRIFTMSALLGVVTTARIAQICVGCTPDGVLGLNHSIPSINRSISFNSDFDYVCTMFLRNKCFNYPEYSTYLKGWLNRIDKVSNYDR